MCEGGLDWRILILIVPSSLPGSNLRRDLVTLSTNFSNSSSHHEVNIQQLTSNCEPDLKGALQRGGSGWGRCLLSSSPLLSSGGALQNAIKSLKAEVEDHGEELQAGESLWYLQHGGGQAGEQLPGAEPRPLQAAA